MKVQGTSLVASFISTYLRSPRAQLRRFDLKFSARCRENRDNFLPSVSRRNPYASLFRREPSSRENPVLFFATEINLASRLMVGSRAISTGLVLELPHERTRSVTMAISFCRRTVGGIARRSQGPVEKYLCTEIVKSTVKNGIVHGEKSLLD